MRSQWFIDYSFLPLNAAKRIDWRNCDAPHNGEAELPGGFAKPTSLETTTKTRPTSNLAHDSPVSSSAC